MQSPGIGRNRPIEIACWNLRGSVVRESWSQVVSRLEQRKRDWVSLESVGSVLDVARFVSEGPLATGLFGSVSLGGLLLAQTEASFEYPHYGPHLRVAPEDQGLVSFTYVDTQNKALQWHRVVNGSDAIQRLLRFLDEMRWFPRETLTSFGIAW
jgi:hypothetical protein